MSKHSSDRVALWRRVGTVRLRAFFALGVVGVLGATGTTFAAWTDSVPITGTSFTAGTIDLTVNTLNSSTTYADLTLGAMVPGNSAAAVLTVRNIGSAAIKYDAVTTTTNADGKGLGAALVVKVTGDASTSGSGQAKTCAGTALNGTGTSLGGALVSTKRLLGSGTSETLCVQVTLPTTAATGLQGATTNVGITFTATSDLS